MLAAELKELYTAVTRPQQRLWIVDDALFPAGGTEAEKHPMLQYWEAGGVSDDFTLVNTAEEYSQAASFASLAHHSTPEEWARQGKYLFEHNHYAQAEHCYSRAGAGFRLEQGISRAFTLQSEAERFAGREERAEAVARFREAAERFCALDMPERSSKCYDAAGMNREAGDILRKHEKYELAAKQYLKCTVTSESFSRRDACLAASECLELAGEQLQALEVLQGANLWPEALRMLNERGDAIDPRLRANVARLAFLHFRKKRGCAAHEDEALRLCGNDAEQERFLLAHRCHDRLVELYRTTGQHGKAAKILHEEGLWLEAARDYRAAQLPRLAGENTVRGVAAGMRWRPDGRVVLEGLSEAEAHEALASAIDVCSGSRDELRTLGYKCLALRAMLGGDVGRLLECTRYFGSRQGQVAITTAQGALLAADLMRWELRYTTGP